MKMSFQNLLSVIENERINSREDSETETNLSSYSYPPSSPSLPSSPLSFGSNEDSGMFFIFIFPFPFFFPYFFLGLKF